VTSINYDFVPTRPALGRAEFAVYAMTALLIAAAAALVLIGAEAWSGSLPDLELLVLLH
jgi:hypothetical protein